MNLFSKRGLSFKMIVFVFINVFVVTTLILTYIYRVSYDIIFDKLKENSKLLTTSTVNEMEKMLYGVQKTPFNIGKLVELNNYSQPELKKLLIQIIGNNPEIFGSAIAFEPGYFNSGQKYNSIYVYRYKDHLEVKPLGNENYDYFSMDWYKVPKELEQPYWSEPYFDEGGGNIVMCTYSVPIYKYYQGEKKFIGVVTADISLDWLKKIIGDLKVENSGYAFLISKNGTIISHPMQPLVMKETVFGVAEKIKSPVLKQIGQNMLAGKTSFAEIEYYNVTTGKKSWISYTPVKTSRWSLGIVYPVDEFTSPLHSLFTQVIIWAFIGFLVLLTVLVFIAKSVTRPLRKLALATEKFGDGDFNAELPEIKSEDEIGELTKSFSVMQNTLKQTFDKLKSANEELEEYSKTLEEKVEIRTAELSEKNIRLDKALGTVKTLSQIGQEITSTLNLESIFTTLYENVNKSLDASSFSIQVINEAEQMIEGKLAIENGERLPEFIYSLNDKNRFAVWCIDNKKPIFINDVENEYNQYIAVRSKPKAGKSVESLMFLPLMVNEKVIGVVTAQSFHKNAYTQNDLNILSNLANYAAIALDNAFAYEKINKANKELKEAQSQLIQAEKMASLGQLTAGIAHEIKNPLNFINNFSELTVDLSKELREEIEALTDKLDEKTIKYFDEIISDIEHNAEKINSHGKRADSIVKGMLLHSRGKSGEKQKTNINDMLAEYMNLAYHGYRAQDSTFNLKMESEYDKSIQPVEVVPQNLSRVFLNIFNNGCYSVHEKKKEKKDGYDPVLRVETKNLDDKIEIIIRDNGKGIPQDILDKIFNPFFTTKPTGKGTGLGLSLSYDIIVQEHKGELKVNSEPGEFAEFVIIIPKNL